MERPIIMDWRTSVPALLRGDKTETRRVIKPQPECCGGPAWRAYADDGGRWHCGTCGGGMCMRRRDGDVEGLHCPYGVPGDLLWCRESHVAVPTLHDDGEIRDVVHFRAGHPDPGRYRWRSPLFMPKWAARIWLRVLEVRVERVQDIDVEGIKAEGVPLPAYQRDDGSIGPLYRLGTTRSYAGPDLLADWTERDYWLHEWANLWDSINSHRDGPKHIRRRTQKGKPVDRWEGAANTRHGPYAWAANPWVWVVRFEVVSTTGRPK